MPTFAVSPVELTRVAGTLSPTATTVSATGSSVQDTIGVPVGLGPLDSALGDLASTLGSWLTLAGKNIQTLAYNTQLAGDLYARAEADNVQAAGGGNSASTCTPSGCVA